MVLGTQSHRYLVASSLVRVLVPLREAPPLVREAIVNSFPVVALEKP